MTMLRKLPIGLLGLIAQQGLNASNAEKLRELSEPITISDLMTDNWINEAFENAKKAADKATSMGDAVGEFLERNTPAIMDMWRADIGEEAYLAFIKMLAHHDELIEPIGRLTEFYTTAGYLFAKYEQEKQ